MAFRRMPSVALVALCSPVLAQNFNIDIGLSQNGPASTYAAAGLPGVWNSITAPHTMPPTPAGQITNGST